MDYEITRWVAGSSDEIAIDKERFEQICTAKDGVLLGLELEERLAFVLESYHEFEVELFAHGHRWALHEDWRWKSRQDEVFALNRRLLNFLNAVAMYREHVEGEVKRRSSVPQDLEEEMIRELNLAFEARCLLAVSLLRNYCQHQGLGFEGVGVTNARIQATLGGDQPVERIFTSAVLAVRVADLSVRRNHPTQSLLTDLRAKKIEQWDPGPELREAVDSLTQLHSTLREYLAPKLELWQEQLNAVIREAEAAFGDIIGLCVVERRGRGNYGEPVQVFPELLARIDELKKRNGGPTVLGNRIITSAPPLVRT